MVGWVCLIKPQEGSGLDPEAVHALSERANDVIRQNIWASIGMKALLAVGVTFGLVNVAVAVVVGDMGMSLGVTTNALRLARLAPDRFE